MKKRHNSYFLIKLFTILNNLSYSRYIRWSEDGLSFIIFNQKGLCENVLNRFFRYRNWSSFQRMLCIYGFRIEKTSKEFKKYRHNEFNRLKTLDEIRLLIPLYKK